MNQHLTRLIQGAAVAVLTLPSIQAAETDLANVPLANATSVTVLPNIMFILDDSGSMDWDYMPDYVDDSSPGFCRDNHTEDGNTDGNLDRCRFGDPPFMANAFNRAYYNPMVNYAAPKNADGTSKTSYSTWTAVPLDGYGIQFTSTNSYPRDNNVFSNTVTDDDWAYNRGYNIDLTTQFPERKWCKSSSVLATCDGDKKTGLSGSTYTYPDGTYKYLKTDFGAPYYYNVTVEWCKNATSGYGSSSCQTKKTSTYKYVKFSNWTRVNVTPATTSYPGPGGTTRTYAEEMTNFANWFAWYRTRMQMMKSAMSLAFADVRGTPNDADATDKTYFHARVGFSTINNTGTTDGTEFLTIGNFDAGQKSSWYTKLFATVPSSSTPLRKALTKAGRIYAGKIGTDPVQYSCQRNFAILSTDGYYNDSSTDANQMDGSTDVGDQDGDATCSTITRPSCDSLRKSNTLADVAYYYYHTNLRPAMTPNVPSAGNDENVDDVAEHQHMTTFTIGLGVDGTLTYADGYKNLNSGDYYNIKQGTSGYKWPDPIANTGEERIDDLWHAAVNGRGTYFSARDPASLVNGLTTALGSIKSTTGSGAAAATSNLQPTAGDNFIYIANYRTVKWDGELSAYTIDLSSGAVSSASTWQASSLLDAKIGTTGNSDTRSIYTSLTGSSALTNFTWANLTATERAYFDNTKLSQYADWSDTNKAAASAETMINYLRGQNRNEDQDRAADYGTYYRLYRDREKTLGDIVHSQPIYVAEPLYDYSDAGYTAYKNSNSGRAASVYVAANDGMLHAFTASTGQERWAYVPVTVMKEMWRLADKDFSTSGNHRFYVDGPVAVSDVNAGGWKTILVGALGKGGRGVYALDVTNPASPLPLWKFSTDENQNVGYTYGMPMITKLTNGTWVVVVASGYNNVPEGANYPDADGVGRVFVLDAGTGAVIRTISTGVGSVTTPSGLTHLNIKVADFQTDNTTISAYGGDLLGNMWRFNLDDGSMSRLIALGASQPITTPPELGDIDGHTVLFFGTGRYLGSTDLDDTQTQAIYGIRDDGSTQVTLADLTAQSMSGSGTSRSVTSSSVSWDTGYGWYINLPDSGERVHLPAQLYFGTLLISSLVPQATECQPGGYSWLYFLDYRTGGRIETNTVALRYTSPLVGLTVAKLPGGTPKVYGITADGGVPPPPPDLPISTAGTGGATSGKRIMWRELLD